MSTIPDGESAEPVPAAFEKTPLEEDLVERHQLDDEQLMFRRRKIAEKGIELFKQEYPSTADEAFLTSSLREILPLPAAALPLKPSWRMVVIRRASVMRPIALASVLCSLLFAGSAMAQTQHIATPSLMRQAVADQSVTDQQNRAAVVGVLHQPQVRDLANRLGLNLTTAENAVSTLSSADLAKVADQARTADTQLAGGSNMVIISTTTLLLILIIVILIVR